MQELLSNKIRTPDGTILQSFHRHDYKTYKDANGEIYMVDGGLGYLRRNVATEPFEELSINTGSDFELIREEFVWGTYGKDGDQPLKHVTLKDMSNSHILNILDTQFHVPRHIRELFEQEYEYRVAKGIDIQDK